MVGTWRSLVAYLNGVQGVAGSNPAVPTSFTFQAGPSRRGRGLREHFSRAVDHITQPPTNPRGTGRWRCSPRLATTQPSARSNPAVPTSFTFQAGPSRRGRGFREHSSRAVDRITQPQTSPRGSDRWHCSPRLATHPALREVESHRPDHLHDPSECASAGRRSGLTAAVTSASKPRTTLAAAARKPAATGSSERLQAFGRVDFAMPERPDSPDSANPKPHIGQGATPLCSSPLARALV
jgi:hypothetical protein